MIVSSTKKAVLGAIRNNLSPKLVSSIDDVAQDAYLRLYKYIKKNGMQALEQKSLSSFMYVIARNESLRTNAKNKLEYEPLDHEIEFSDSDRQESFHVHTMIAELSNELKQVAEMYLTGYKQKEIANYLQIPVGTVKSRLHRIRKTLGADEEKNNANE